MGVTLRHEHLETAGHGGKHIVSATPSLTVLAFIRYAGDRTGGGRCAAVSQNGVTLS